MNDRVAGHGPQCQCGECGECDAGLVHDDRDTLPPPVPHDLADELRREQDQLALAVLPTALQHLLAEHPSGAFSVDTLAQRAHDLASALVAWRPE